MSKIPRPKAQLQAQFQAEFSTVKASIAKLQATNPMAQSWERVELERELATQAAEIKLETFSFTKYGTVEATVSADAVTD